MEQNIFRFILRYSIRHQLVLIGLSAVALPILYMTLELPKTIVNEAIDGSEFPKFIAGQPLEQIPYLLVLCGFFLALVILSGILKFITATYRYRIGDRLLRRLRYDMIERLLRFPPAEFRNLSSGQVVSMITAETTTLGFFIAEAFAVPAIAFGTLSTILLFMFMQNWLMGLAAIALYPVQIYLIPKIQRKINKLQRGEVEAIRGVSQRISDVVAGVDEIHGHDTSQYELADFSQRLGRIFRFRISIDRNRYLANILNQFISQLTPFFFLSIGGYLVINKQISLGSLVAVLAAYKDMYSPWKDLIEYYQKAEDARVRYDQLKEFFARPDLLDKTMIEDEIDSEGFGQGRLVAENVVLEHEEGHRSIDGASMQLTLPTHIAILGSGGSGREEFARLLARQNFAHSGSVQLGDMNLAALPDSVTGRRIGFVGRQTFLRSGSLYDALAYPLLRRPQSFLTDAEIMDEDLRYEHAESLRAGNSRFHAASDWIDYAAAGCSGESDLRSRMIEILGLVDLDREVYDIGLNRPISPQREPVLVEKLLQARNMFRQRLETARLDGYIEAFDPDRYNSYATVAENIIFGTPVGSQFWVENLGRNEFMRQVLAECDLTTDFLEMGRKLAAIKTEIFQGLAPDHEFFERFSFINSAELPLIKKILLQLESRGFDALSEDDQQRLMSLPFKLVEKRHKVGLIDEDMQQRLLAARRCFAQTMPPNLRHSVQFFQQGSYNAACSIAENIIFGKTASGKAGSTEQVGQLLDEIVAELGLREDITAIGLEFQIGVGGSRLTAVQHQKVALARCLIKRPEILIMNEAMSSMDRSTQERILSNIKTELQGRSLILFESSEERRQEFENVLKMDRGRFVNEETGQKQESSKQPVPQAAQQPKAPGPRPVGLNEIATLLMDIPLFRDIDRSKLKLLAFTSERVQFEPHQEVFHQGDPGDRAYVIVDGSVDVVLETPSGESTVATLGRNEFFGEMALLSKIPRTTTIRARTPVVLLGFSQDVFLRLVEENSEIARAMMRVLTERLAATLQDYSQAVTRNQIKEPDQP